VSSSEADEARTRIAVLRHVSRLLGFGTE
jgi:hypothetical protein